MNNQDFLETQYRKMYWEKNELQIMLPDVPDKKYCEELIADLEYNMNKCCKDLGYTPEA